MRVTFSDDEMPAWVWGRSDRDQRWVRAWLHFEKALNANDIATCTLLMDDPATAELLIDRLVTGVSESLARIAGHR
jgi:hypothetical protein